MDLLLVTPPSRNGIYQGLAKDLAAKEIPVWSGLLANFARKNNMSVELLDGEAQELSFAQCAQKIVDIDATLTVFVVYGQQPSASTQCMPAARAVCEEVYKKNARARTLVMGTHASALPEQTLKHEPYTFVCQGEGPKTILALIEALRSKHPDFSRVPGLWYRDSDQIKGNPTAALIQDLDGELPGVAWDLFQLKDYRAHNWHCFGNTHERSPYASLPTSLGCPYKCSFCCINAPFGKSTIRCWSPDRIIEQMDYLVSRGVRNIKIPDEMFVLNENHVLGICDRIIQRGYDLNIWAYARVDTVKDKFLDRLRLAGIRWLALGIESASKHVRDGSQKGRFGDTDIIAVVEKIRASGIYVCANYIFGLPDDTMESMRETLTLARTLNTEWANFYSAMAYPGSRLYSTAVKQGWPLPADWTGYSQHSVDCLPLPTETLSGGQVLAFRDSAFLKYFTDPHYLDMMERSFGLATKNHLLQMTEHKLQRRFSAVGSEAATSSSGFNKP